MLQYVPHPGYVGRGTVGRRSNSAFDTKRLVSAGVPAGVSTWRLYDSSPHSASEMDSGAESGIRKTGFGGGV